MTKGCSEFRTVVTLASKIDERGPSSNAFPGERSSISSASMSESALATGFLFFVVTIALALPGAGIIAVEALRAR